MINLLEETIEVLKDNGLKVKDIVFIGSVKTGEQCLWEQFKELANKDYSNDFTPIRVRLDLIIVFKDGTRLVRKDYDWSEWWEIIKPFKVPKIKHRLKDVFYPENND